MNPANTTPITYQSLNFAYKLSLFDDHWQARVIAEMNDYQFKLVKLQGTSSGTTTRTPTRPLSSSKANCASTSPTAR